MLSEQYGVPDRRPGLALRAFFFVPQEIPDFRAILVSMLKKVYPQ
jgi:hypothetical protein